MVAQLPTKLDLKKVHMNGIDEPAGKSYGELPAEMELPFCRPLEPRLSFILKHVDNYAKVIDLGCNAGHYCFALAQRGNQCVGIDDDASAISAAMAVEDKLQTGRVEFIHRDVTEFAPEPRFILYLSTFQWAVKKHGLANATEHLRRLARPGNFMIFETSGSDSKAPLPQADHKTWIVELLKYCGWDIIDEMKHKAETGGERWVFACRSSMK